MGNDLGGNMPTFPMTYILADWLNGYTSIVVNMNIWLTTENICIIYLLERVLVTYSNSRKSETPVVVNLHVDVDRPVIVEHDSIHNLVAYNADACNHCGYPHQSEIEFRKETLSCRDIPAHQIGSLVIYTHVRYFLYPYQPVGK